MNKTANQIRGTQTRISCCNRRRIRCSTQRIDEIDCQGVKTVVKSKRSVLARLSAIRGDEGELSGVPFIDDYVVIKNHIVDYHKYSGINPGDLDPAHSAKPLVPREVVYRKVWLLLKLGCVFVGHGLSNDFEHINLNVPKEQIRDTAYTSFRARGSSL